MIRIRARPHPNINIPVRLVDSGEYAVAFSLNPTSIRELIELADQDQIMPPKSTWFEPKLRSGLVVHPLS